MFTVLQAPIDLIKNATTVLLIPIVLLKEPETLKKDQLAAEFAASLSA